MDLVSTIKSRDSVSLMQENLQDFITKNDKLFSFQELNSCSIQKELWNSLLDLLKDQAFSECHSQALHILKILSRDKQYLDEILNQNFVELLLEKAALDQSSQSQQSSQDFKCILESQKCIFNLVFSHEKSRSLFADSCLAKGILQRLSLSDIPHDVVMFDLKILFLLTALCSSCRSTIRFSLKGTDCLLAHLERCLAAGVDELDNNTVYLCCESLKIIFNLLLSSADATLGQDDDLELHCKLMQLIRKVLSVKSNALEKREDLKSHAINLMTNLRPECYGELVPTSSTTSEDTYEGQDVSTLTVLLGYLEERLGKPTRVLQEELLPVLTVLIQCASKQRTVRKCLRHRVLPPLRNVSRRPEQGEELRNKLCRLMTSTVTQVEFLVAEFLFVLCKENVSRFIKYTGYGNAAGLLAHRGLMMGQNADHVSPYYSSDSDSETEEYKQAENGINPITGSYETPRPNPLENMSEEQKEYEAIKLINMIDQLQRNGIIQPARVGEDGKPQSVSHVLELQKK